jgi:hypothetical protein
MDSDKDGDNNVKLHRVQQICGTIITVLASNVWKETLFKFCKSVEISTSALDAYVMAKGGPKAAEMRLLRPVSEDMRRNYK